MAADANTAIVQAELLIAKGNPAGALALLDKFEGPKYEGLIVVQARAHEQARDFAAALECLEPVISSGKASDEAQYSYARLLRDRYGYAGELRAVGDVLLEQLHFMHRSGFDAFDVSSEHPVEDWETAQADLSIWYQPTGDGRETALQRRLGR